MEFLNKKPVAGAKLKREVKDLHIRWIRAKDRQEDARDAGDLELERAWDCYVERLYRDWLWKGQELEMQREKDRDHVEW